MSNTIDKIGKKIVQQLNKKEEFAGVNGVIIRDLSSAILNLTNAERVRDDMKATEKDKNQ